MENKKIDLRKISHEELQKIKIEAMNLRDEGVSNLEVAQELNIDPSVLSRWYRKYMKNYRQLQHPVKRGRKKGTQKNLTDYQEEMIIKTLQEYPGLLDKQLVKNEIEEKYNMIFPTATTGDYLRKWGVNSSLIKEFENDFIKRVGIEEFQSIQQEIKKRNGIIIWINIMDYELTGSARVHGITTRVTNNKLIFKLYKKWTHAVDLIDFVNQLATLYIKNLYVIFDTKNIEVIDEENGFKNSEKVTFIYRI